MSDAAIPRRKSAAFFDVDGTLVRATVVHYYVYFRSRLLTPFWRGPWYAAYLAKCAYYLLLDRIDRSRFNIVFYRGYAGLPTARIKELVSDCYRDVIHPRRFAEAADCVARHRQAGPVFARVA